MLVVHKHTCRPLKKDIRNHNIFMICPTYLNRAYTKPEAFESLVYITHMPGLTCLTPAPFCKTKFMHHLSWQKKWGTLNMSKPLSSRDERYRKQSGSHRNRNILVNSVRIGGIYIWYMHFNHFSSMVFCFI